MAITLPATYHQRSLASATRTSAINLMCVVRLPANTPAQVVDDALRQIEARHEALRTRLVADSDGQAVQIVEQPGDLHAEVATSGAWWLAGLPFDLTTDRLTKAWLTDDHGAPALALVLHHAVTDAASMVLLTEELVSALRGEPLGPAPVVQLADYAQWETTPRPAAALDWWRSRLAPSTARTVLTRASQPGGARFSAHPLDLGQGGSYARASSAAASMRVPVLAVLLAATAAACRTLYDGDRITLGVMQSNRERPELARTVGFLADHLPVSLDLTGPRTLRDLVGEAAGAYEQARAHRIPSGALWPILRRDDGPMLDVGLNLVNDEPPPADGEAPVAVLDVEAPAREEIARATANPPVHPWWSAATALDLQLRRQGDQIVGAAGAAVDLVSADQAQEIATRLVGALDAVCDEPDRRIEA